MALITNMTTPQKAEFLTAITSSGGVSSAQLMANNGAGLIGIRNAGVGAVDSTVERFLLEKDVSPFQFMDATTQNKVTLRTATTADATAITAAIQAAINTGKRVRIPNGLYHVVTGFDITQSTYIEGESSLATIILPASASFNLFRIASNNVIIKNLTIQGNSTQTGSVFRWRSSVGNFEMLFLENIETRQCHHFLTDDNSTGVLVLCYIENCFHRQPTGNGIDINDVFAYFFVDRFTVDYVGVTAPSSNTPGIRIRSGQGCRLTNIDILGGSIVGFSSRRGIDIQNSEAVWLRDCMADTMGGEGIYLSNCTGIYLNTVTGSLCDLHQIVLNACVNVIGTSIYAGGRASLSGTAGQNGLRISGDSSVVSLASVLTVSCTGFGYLATGASTGALITGLTSHFNTTGGFRLEGLACMVVGCQLNGYSAGNNYQLNGTFNHVSAVQLSSGAFVANATGTTSA